MRFIPAELQAKLDGGVTTLAHCWKLSRRDGVVLGFTDHDENLELDGITFRAATGFTASEAISRFNLSTDGSEVSGALSHDSLSEHDLAGGRFDAAEIECWLVDYTAPALRVLTARGRLGEVRREGLAFTAELRGMADLLAQDSGRLYTAACGADLGDRRCGVDLAAPGLRASGTVSALRGLSQFAASGLSGFAAGWFTAGKLIWTGGANSGLAIEVKSHRTDGGTSVLTLWQKMPEAIVEGDGFTVTAGCDKHFATCRGRFANSENFRGFPHIPGNDFLISVPTPGKGRTGENR